jgi:DNA-binding CsgD family transcriptional regulator/tetratricopeptide (TPR) repeat protein
VNAVAALDRGRESYARQAWTDAYESLSAADRLEGLGAEDLELLATAAYMIGDEDDYFGLLERAHHAHLDAGGTLEAIRCAFWIGANLARAQRLLEGEQGERVEHGYMLIPLVFQQEASGDLDAAAATAGEAAAIGARFGDPDLFALAAHAQGHLLIQNGRVDEGLRLLDEAMVTVTSGELSPIVSGIVYCGVILACQDAYEVRRAQEWTAALTRWCERQPDLVAFTGRCLVHRAEIMQLHGSWTAALDEARQACERCVQAENVAGAGDACYRQGEILRLLGDFSPAEDAYREASGHGREPQPGLALLRLAQGRGEAAAAAIRRVVDETSEISKRARVLPAYVEITLAEDDIAAAREANTELESIAEGQEDGALGAIAAHARGAVELASGNVAEALVALRGAGRVWQQLGAPYEAARARELVGVSCRELGDEEAAALELDAARTVFVELGAAPEVTRLDSLISGAARMGRHGLTAREVEVLRQVSSGATNKAIAADLVLSVRTVDRHVSNIFAKLGVSSRSAATAYAHEHGIV